MGKWIGTLFAFCKLMKESLGKMAVFMAGLVMLSVLATLVFSFPLLLASCLTQ